jgi:hypothetical protein
MPLQNESKRNNNWIKELQPPIKNIEILIMLYLILMIWMIFNMAHQF